MGHRGVLAVEIVPLRRVVTEVVEFGREFVRLVAAFLFEPFGFALLAVVVTGAGINENPIALPNGKLAAAASSKVSTTLLMPARATAIASM